MGTVFNADILFRHGNLKDFDPSKIRRGEPALAVDTGQLFVGTGDGTVVELASADSVGCKQYGVRRAVGSTQPVLERVGHAAGLTAAAGVGNDTVVNDFDRLYPWSGMRRCNLDDGGNVLAYYGEPGYAADGSKGQVMVEIPRFYQKYEKRDGYEYWWVCALPLAGYRLSPAFIGSDEQVLDKIYVSAYAASCDSTEKACSISGVYPEVRRSRTSFRTIARARGSGWGLLDIACLCDVLQFLFVVEYATLHSQSVMFGIANLPYVTTHTATVSESATNRIVLSSAFAALYVVGQSIEIGTTIGGGQVARNRTVTAITVLENGFSALEFDGPPIDSAVGNMVYSMGWKAGGADGVAASSGSSRSNSDKKSPFQWRGIENMWGNVCQWVDGVNVHNYRIFVARSPALYDDMAVSAPYRALNYSVSPSNGYIRELGCDTNVPWARLPVVSNGAYEIGYCDHSWFGPDLRALYFGGYFDHVYYVGLFYVNGQLPASYSGPTVGARLMYKS